LWPGKLLPEEGLLFLAMSTSAWGGFTLLARNTSDRGAFTLPCQEFFCLRKVYTYWPGILLPKEGYSSWPGMLLPDEGLLFLARTTSAGGGFTLPCQEYFCRFILPGREYFCLMRVYSSWPGILQPEEGSLFFARNTSD
jgi:hypothetical protein